MDSIIGCNTVPSCFKTFSVLESLPLSSYYHGNNSLYLIHSGNKLCCYHHTGKWIQIDGALLYVIFIVCNIYFSQGSCKPMLSSCTKIWRMILSSSVVPMAALCHFFTGARLESGDVLPWLPMQTFGNVEKPQSHM